MDFIFTDFLYAEYIKRFPVAEMCHAKILELEPEETPTTMQQVVAYNQQQWLYFNELFVEIHAGRYGDHYNFLLAELVVGPYWASIKARLGQVKEEYDPKANVSGSREPLPKDDSSSDSSDSDTD